MKSIRETSVKALRSPDFEADSAKLRERVFNLMKDPGCWPWNWTGSEINKKLNSTSAHKRLSELKRIGCIVDEGQRRCGVTGKMAIYWKHVPGTTLTSTAKVPRHSLTKKEKEQALNDLRMLCISWRSEYNQRSGPVGGRPIPPAIVLLGEWLRRETE